MLMLSPWRPVLPQYVWSNWSLGRCIQFLNEHNILSAPVMDAAFPEVGPGATRPVTERCIGMVDVIECTPPRSARPTSVQPAVPRLVGRAPTAVCRAQLTLSRIHRSGDGNAGRVTYV